MILAGDIGGTHARLAVFDVNQGRFQLVTSSTFPSQQFAGLDDIVVQFLKNARVQPTQACFGIAGPVTNGRVEASNLPWIVEGARLAQELKMSAVELINELSLQPARAWGRGDCTGMALATMSSPPRADTVISRRSTICRLI